MKYYYLPLLAILLFSCTNDVLLQSEEVEPALADLPEQQQQSKMYTQGHVRILLTEGLSDKVETAVRSGKRQLDALPSKEVVTKTKIRSMKRTFPEAGRFEARTRKAGLHLWYDVEFDTEVPLGEARQNLSGIQGVKKVEYRPVATWFRDDNTTEIANEITNNITKSATAAVPFNDPRLPEQWHYQNEDGYSSINLFGAWEYTTGSPDVVVAVIDGGIDYEHEDLAANMWINEAEKNGTSGLDDDRNGFKDDIHGYNFVSDVGKLVPHNHGTHVAGTVAAVNNNGKGVAGVAGGNGQSNSGVRLMSCQIFVAEDDPYVGNTGSKGAQAIKYAADNGAVICQNSWGYETLTVIPGSDKAAIDYFIEYAGIDENGRQTGAMRGGIVIFAAGNENRAEAPPANYEKVVAVSALARDFRKASYSNYGEWVDLAAPGNSILSTVVGGYGYNQGTSMACPHVSGVAALVLSQFKRSGYNADMLRARLENSAVNIDDYNSSYRGKLGKLVDAVAALASGSTTPPSGVGKVTGDVYSNTVTLRWTVPSDPDDGKASGFNVYYRKAPITGINVNNPPEDVMISSFSTGNLNAGDTYEAEIEDLEFSTQYYLAVNAFDFSGNFSPLSAQVTQTTQANNTPLIIAEDGVDVTMQQHQTVALRFSGSDPDGHELNWSLEPANDGVELVDLGSGKAQVTITGTKVEAGAYTMVLTLADKYGAATTETISYKIFPNHDPEIVSEIENLHLGAIGQQKSFAIADYFTDQDNEILRYSFTNTAPGVVNVNENNGTLYVVSMAYGLSQVTITATDAMGKSAVQEFSVLVRDDNQIVDVYPNPAKDFIWLRTGEAQRAQVTINSNSGAKVFEAEMDISPFEPAKIDVSAFSGGVYNVHIKYDEKEIKKQIIKL
ncbi:Por secretion system C-terminal sorting domain-containing protein [Mariniphaga anaerophila]|uniref:Por secretion system C-terminal sorting domain-containing protein n=1 Tax=Mariniphaga anaerophila TaxID=1484053 RepID=A0A1M4VNG5_9BACT|nr:S8 family serine peptidase [Mariniphaga anaerophila]SHE70641.1 Por secretion system C-terminal sorting domain-containing protein [Mariniphaga anaerophila]